VEAEENAAEQRAILASFEMRRRNETTQQFMDAERRTAAARLADAHATACVDAHCHNIEAARAAMAAAEQRLAQADRVGGLAMVKTERQRRKNQYPLASFDPWAERQEERCTFTSFLDDAERRHHERVSEESRSRCGMVPCRPGRWVVNAPPPSGANAAGEDSADNA
jgi:hypothetical protein